MARIAVLLLVACALRAQSVDGTLINSVNHTPISNVIVTLLGPARYNGTTDENGAFHIQEVKPGRYFLNIVKAGFVLSLESRAPFQVERDTRISIGMDPLGRVEGRVRYPDGRPAPNAAVRLNNLAADADLGGHFVFEDVKPGSYVLRAVASPVDPKPDGEIWAATWYPSTTDRASAEPIPIAIGDVLTRDVRLRSVPARRIHGVVRDDAGRPAAFASLTLKNGAEEHTAVTAEDGAFDFVVHDGDWRAAATRTDGAVELRGAASITVARNDVENAGIRMALPFALPIVVDGDAPSLNGRRLPTMVWLMPADGGSSPLRAEQGSVSIYPGVYRILANLPLPDQYLESIKLGGIDATGKPVQIWDGSQPLRITYRRFPASIRGVVEKGEGAMVVLIDPEENAVTGTAGPDGRFEFRGLRPGDYSVIAFDHGEPTALGNPAVWRPLLPRAERVHVDRGETAFVSLKALPGR